MKGRLRTKYVPVNYKSQLIDTWQRIEQKQRSLRGYINEFQELMIAYELDEDQLSIISRFKTGLREDIKVELELREVSTLDEAYKIALRLDGVFKKNPRYSNLNQPRTFNRGQENSPPNIPPNSNLNVGMNNSLPKITPFTNSFPRNNPNVKCFNFQQVGHDNINCPKLALVCDGYYVAYKPITLSCILFMFIKMKFIHCHSCVMFGMKSMSMCNDYVNYDEIII